MDDLISRQAAIDALHAWFRDGFDEDKWWNSTHVLAAIEGLPSVQQGHKWETCFECPLSHGCPKIKGCTNEQAIEYASQIPNDCPLSVQPDITDEQAIGHLQASGWMQSHDKQMYEMGLKERLADDSDSYDALLPSSQPEIIRCKDCMHNGSYDTDCPIDWNGKEYCSFAERITDEGSD